MSSENKKRKAKNSHIIDGGEKVKSGKCKRLFYYTKSQRIENKKENKE